MYNGYYQLTRNSKHETPKTGCFGRIKIKKLSSFFQGGARQAQFEIMFLVEKNAWQWSAAKSRIPRERDTGEVVNFHRI